MIPIFVRYRSMADLLMDWVTLRFIGGLIKKVCIKVTIYDVHLIAVLSFCGTFLFINLMTLLISYRPIG